MRREQAADPSNDGLRPTNIPDQALKLARDLRRRRRCPASAVLANMAYEGGREVLPDDSAQHPRLDALRPRRALHAGRSAAPRSCGAPASTTCSTAAPGARRRTSTTTRIFSPSSRVLSTHHSKQSFDVSKKLAILRGFAVPR